MLSDRSLLVLSILAHIVFTIFTVYWDTVQDWGLLHAWKKETFLLRDELVYRHRVYYYLAAVLDLLLRMVFFFQISSVGHDWVWMMPFRHVLIFVEIFRCGLTYCSMRLWRHYKE